MITEGCDGVNYQTLPAGRSNMLYFWHHFVPFSSVLFANTKAVVPLTRMRGVGWVWSEPRGLLYTP